MSSGFPYKKILMIGGTSGLGSAWAARFIKEGHSTIVVGRRQENLDKFVSEHGKGAYSSRCDISDIKSIPAWTESVLKEHPDIDCVFLNAGVQRLFNWAKPESVDMERFENELTTNYLSYIHLTKAFLPHLMKFGETGAPTALVGITSGLAIIPMTRASGYCATKAALHSFFLSVRSQVYAAGKKVQIIELLPPAVQTELHDAKHQPELGVKGSEIGQPIDEFIEETWAAFQTGEDQLPIGFVKGFYAPDGSETMRQKAFEGLTAAMKDIPLNY